MSNITKETISTILDRCNMMNKMLSVPGWHECEEVSTDLVGALTITSLILINCNSKLLQVSNTMIYNDT